MSTNVALASNGGIITVNNGKSLPGASLSYADILFSLHDGYVAGNPGLFPISTDTPITITVALYEKTVIDTAIIYFPTNPAYSYGYKVLVSEDGIAFTTVVDKTSSLFYGKQSDSFSPVMAKFVNISIEKSLKSMSSYGVPINEIEVYSSDKPYVEYTVSPTSGVAPLTVSVKSVARNVQNILYGWGNAAGSPILGTISRSDVNGIFHDEVKFIFDNAGQFDTKMICVSRDQVGQKNISMVLPTITVREAPAFTITYDHKRATFTRTNRLNEAGVWDFGDGGASIEISPDHIYKTEGNFAVTLTVGTDVVGATATVFDWTYTANPLNPLEITFYTDYSGGSFPHWKWRYGDGIVEDQQSNIVKHVYAQHGQYTVSCWAYAIQNQASQEQQVTVLAPLTPKIVSFTIDNDTVRSGGEIALTWQTQDADRVIINGTEYPANGMVKDRPEVDTVYQLKAIGMTGITTESQVMVKTYIPVTASFRVTPTSGDLPLTVNLVDTSTGTIVSRTWTIEGKTFSDPQLSYVFVKSGNYTIWLKIEGMANVGQVSQKISVSDPVKALQDEIARLKSELAAAHDEAVAAINKTNSLQEYLDKATKEGTLDKAAIADLQVKLGLAIEATNSAISRANSLGTALDKALSDDEADKAAIADLRKQVAQDEADMDKMKYDLQGKLNELAAAGQKYTDMSAVIDDLQTELNKAKSDNVVCTNSIQSLEASLRQAEIDRDTAYKSITTIQADLNKANNAMVADESLISELQSMLNKAGIDYQSAIVSTNTLQAESAKWQTADTENKQKIAQLEAINAQAVEQLSGQSDDLIRLKKEVEEMATSRAKSEREAAAKIAELEGRLSARVKSAPSISGEQDKAVGGIWQWLLLAAGIGLVANSKKRS